MQKLLRIYSGWRQLSTHAILRHISAFPVLGGTGIHISDLKLAWGLTHPKAKKRQSIKFIRDIFGDSKGAEIPGSADA